MTYNTVATFTQVTSMLMFISLFFAVIAYAFWPGNKERFDKAQAKALELDGDSELPGSKT